MNGNSALLDTNAISSLIRGDTGIVETIRNYTNLCISTTVFGELVFGALNSGRVSQNLEALEEALKTLQVLLADEAVAREYGHVRLRLKRSGKPIPENDVWIAATALQNGIPVITQDVHFSHVEGLEVISWS